MSFTQLKALPAEWVNKPRLLNKITLNDVPVDLDKPDISVKYLHNLREENVILLVRDLDVIEKSNTSIHMKANVVGKGKYHPDPILFRLQHKRFLSRIF